MRSHMTRPGGPEILSTEADKVPAPAAIRPREKDTLTDRQKQVLSFISESISERGYPPTLREIGERMGIRSTNGVNDPLKALEKKGYLHREDLKSRALRPIGIDVPSLPQQPLANDNTVP